MVFWAFAKQKRVFGGWYRAWEQEMQAELSTER